MRTHFYTTALLCALGLAGVADAQIKLPQLPFNLPLPNLPKPNIPVPDLPFTPGSAVTTSFKDTYPIAGWLDLIQNEEKPQKGQGFNLKPGYYQYTIQSYCLHAGTYGPTQGAGYAMAPLKGDKAATIRGILQRSANQPQIAQQDIQQLIWGIEAGTRFTDFPRDFQLRVAPLMTPADIAQTFVTLPTLTAQLPDPIKNALNFYQQLRDQLTQSQGDFAALERLAVLSGTPPADPEGRTIQEGVWTAAGPGFYARTFPSSYSKTVLEVLKVAPYRLKRDSLGRITHFESGGYSVDTTYDDRPGQDEVQAGNTKQKVWRFASIRLNGPQPNQSLELLNKGFVFPSNTTATKPLGWLLGSGPQLRFASLTTTTASEADGFNFSERYERAQKIKDTYDRIQDYRDRYDRATRPPSEQSFDDFMDIGHYRDGLEAAMGDMGDKMSWLTDHFQRMHDAYAYAACELAGDVCAPPGANDPAETSTFDPSGFVAVPGNTQSQRLGLSSRLH